MKTIFDDIICKLDNLLIAALKQAGVDDPALISEVPPSIELGDICYPMFKYAKALRSSPVKIAELVIKAIVKPDFVERFEIKGAYINVFLNRLSIAGPFLKNIIDKGLIYGKSESNNRSVMIEFSCPNTNKPLHLGHCRNNVLGMAISNIYGYLGYNVKKVNLINDRGIHICKSMLAYKLFANNSTPESTGRKSDHFVGDNYVRYNKEVQNRPELEKEAQKMLQDWEDGDKEVIALWEMMNQWAIQGINETYKKMGVNFDLIEYESKNYLFGKEIVFDGLKRGVFYKESDGSIWVNNEDVGLDKKILLRSDGTSIYITQDLGTAVKRYEKYGFDSLIYIVGQEQEYHFKTLFAILKKLGFTWAQNLTHLSYGMVMLPEGKMKSREGTVVDADNLLSELENMSLDLLKEKGRFEDPAELNNTAYKVSIAALKYYLLNFSTTKDISFIPEQSISFDGNTGPYLQYTTARINSLLKKSGYIENSNYEITSINDDEWTIILQLSTFETILQKTADQMSPLDLCNFVYDLARLFNKFYQDNSIINGVSDNTKLFRCRLSVAVLNVISIIVLILGFDPLDKM